MLQYYAGIITCLIICIWIGSTINNLLLFYITGNNFLNNLFDYFLYNEYINNCLILLECYSEYSFTYTRIQI